MAAPEVARAAADMAGRAIVVKVDTERYPGLAARFNIRGIPNFVVFQAGRPVAQQAGVMNHQQLLFRSGVELIRKQFEDALTKLGLNRVPAKGETFDPRVHQAVEVADRRREAEKHRSRLHRGGGPAGRWSRCRRRVRPRQDASHGVARAAAENCRRDQAEPEHGRDQRAPREP